jgi:hypothetical protein
LTVGYYASLQVVVSAAVSGAGSCLDAVGSSYDTSFYYPGPGKTGAREWRQYNAEGVLQIQIITLPTTPAAGATTWKGDYKPAFEPSAVDSPGSFGASIMVADACSDVATSTTVCKTTAGGTCTVEVQISRFYAGAQFYGGAQPFVRRDGGGPESPPYAASSSTAARASAVAPRAMQASSGW